MSLREVDSVEITVLVDNILQSTVPADRTDVLSPGQWARGRKVGRLLAAHGFSALVETRVDDEVHRVLYDTGPSENVISHNVDILGVDLSDVEAVVISHGHWDHMGGLEWVLTRVSPDAGVYVMSTAFRRRGVMERTWRGRRIRELDPVPALDAVAATRKRLELGHDPALMAGGTLMASGEIPRITDYEPGFVGHVSFQDGRWIPDELILDDRCLISLVRARGAVVVSGCSHAGIVNMANEASRLTGTRVDAIIGGMHLIGRNSKRRIERTVEDLGRMMPSLIAACHCSGGSAQRAFAKTVPEAYVPCGVGLRYIISASE